MYFIQVMLTCRLRHELPDAIVQSAVNYLIRWWTPNSFTQPSGFCGRRRENSFLASHQRVVPATILPSDMDAF